MDTLRNPLRIPFPIVLAGGALALGMSLAGGNAEASETLGQKLDRVAGQTAGGIRKGAEWAGKGIRQAAVKASDGIDKGVAHAGNGVRKGAEKTGAAFVRIGNRLQQSGG